MCERLLLSERNSSLLDKNWRSKNRPGTPPNDLKLNSAWFLTSDERKKKKSVCIWKLYNGGAWKLRRIKWRSAEWSAVKTENGQSWIFFYFRNFRACPKDSGEVITQIIVFIFNFYILPSSSALVCSILASLFACKLVYYFPATSQDLSLKRGNYIKNNNPSNC